MSDAFTDGPGHLFVIHGDLTALRCDHVLIPTDGQLHITNSFESLFDSLIDEHRGWRVADVHPPDNWMKDDRPALLVPQGRLEGIGTWLVNAANHSGDVEWLVTGILTAVAQVAASHSRATKPQSDRERALIALPMMGIGKGGYAHRRAEVIKAVLTALQEAVSADGHPDVALVLNQRSDYAIIQDRRRALHTCSLPPELDGAARDLAERAKANQLVLFLGAGVSMAAGLPSWAELIAKLAETAGLPTDVQNQLTHLTAADAAEVIRETLENQEGAQIGALENAVRSHLGPERHALAHASLAGLRLPEAITTNYDRLYEQAAQVPFEDHLQVLPRDRAEPGRPWLLKLHGDLFDAGNDLVLTRQDYLKFEAERGPLAAVVQSRLLTNHVLFVGYSLADDNFVRLARQVGDTLRPGHDKLVGTVLTLGPEPARQLLWGKSLHYLPMSISPTTTAEEFTAAARSLEIFLDHVAMHAASEPSYLMDPRYSELLDDDQFELKTALRDLLTVVQKRGEAQSRLKALLKDFGAK